MKKAVGAVKDFAESNVGKVVIGTAVIAAAAVATVATGGAAAGVAGYIAAGALQGAVAGADSDDAYGLTQAKRAANAEYIHNYLIDKGFTSQAACGLLGNIEQESCLNPAAWQSNKQKIDDNSIGYGLVQWTPASKFCYNAGFESESKVNAAAEDPEKLIQMQLDFIISSSQPGQGE